MNISLRELTRYNLRECINLKPAAWQQNFVASNVVSIAQSKVEANWFPLCIYAEEIMVGFAMYGIDSDDGNMWIIRLMVDEKFQGNGYGKAAMTSLLHLIRDKHQCDEIYLSIEPDNTRARILYESLGFVDTGNVIDGEVVFRLLIS